MNENQIIVSVGREHGSGGHFIAQELADNLGIKLYDKEIIEGVVEKGFSREFVEAMDEKPINYFLSRRIGEFSNSPEEIVAEQVFDYIREIAKKGESFVIVGRCADYALASHTDVLNVFIHAEMDDRIKRISKRENITEHKAKDMIQKSDKQRSSYYNYYTCKKWGDARSYDLSLNTSKLTPNQCVDLIMEFREKMKENK